MVLYFIGTRGLEPTPANWQYADLVTVILTATTIILAAIALGIALIAVWGYKVIIEQSEKVARDQADKVATDLVNEYLSREEIKNRIRALVDDRVRKEADSVVDDILPAYPTDLKEGGNAG